MFNSRAGFISSIAKDLPLGLEAGKRLKVLVMQDPLDLGIHKGLELLLPCMLRILRSDGMR